MGTCPVLFEVQRANRGLGGFVIEPEIAVPVVTVGVTSALLFCL